MCCVVLRHYVSLRTILYDLRCKWSVVQNTFPTNASSCRLRTSILGIIMQSWDERCYIRLRSVVECWEYCIIFGNKLPWRCVWLFSEWNGGFPALMAIKFYNYKRNTFKCNVACNWWARFSVWNMTVCFTWKLERTCADWASAVWSFCFPVGDMTDLVAVITFLVHEKL